MTQVHQMPYNQQQLRLTKMIVLDDSNESIILHSILRTPIFEHYVQVILLKHYLESLFLNYPLESIGVHFVPKTDIKKILFKGA